MTPSWWSSLNGKFAAGLSVMSVLVIALVISTLAAVRRLEHATAALVNAGDARSGTVRVLHLAHRLVELPPEARATHAEELRQELADVQQRLQRAMDGDAEGKLLPARSHDPTLRTNVERRRTRWANELTPRLQRLAGETDRARAEAELAAISAALRANGEDVEQAIALQRQRAEQVTGDVRTRQVALGGACLIAVLLIMRLGWTIARRTRALSATAQQIAAGELTRSAPTEGVDELAVLGRAFNDMTTQLRTMLENENRNRARVEQVLQTASETVNALAAASSEILAGTTQQAAGMQQQAASVNETVTTVDQVLATSEQAAERARTVAEISRRTVEVGKAGRRAVEETVTSMTEVQHQVDSIAQSVLSLADRAQSIGEIIAAVTDIADQTNILSLNAAIEASRAGDEGRGFSVVASEVRALAEQAKRSTAQIRGILGEIQKNTNSAVLIAETGNRSINAAIAVVRQAGETIRQLSEAISESAQSAAQIAASSSQQVGGMAQIHQAMKDMKEISSQNLVSTKQAERAARDLHGMGARLKQMLTSYAQGQGPLRVQTQE